MEKILKGMFYCLIIVDDSLNSMLFQRKSGGVKGLSNDLMQLRKICQHPFLFRVESVDGLDLDEQRWKVQRGLC